MASMNYFDFDMLNSTNTVLYFDGKDGNLYLRYVAPNLCCQIRADDNSSQCTFTTGKSVLLMGIRDNIIVLARFNCTSHI